ncbi:MAG: MurR/RpiR family transcriptional regulator [Ruthenibacterium lactatiformans]
MTNIEVRTQNIYENLSNAEKKVASYFLDNVENVFAKPISQLAEESGVSKVAWVRFCKAIGFDGLKDLKACSASCMKRRVSPPGAALRYPKPPASTS